MKTSTKSIRSILPVLRKLAKEGNRPTKFNHLWAIQAVTLGDCRKVKRWLTKMEKKK